MNDWKDLVTIAEAEVGRILHDLPAPLRTKAAELTVVFERRPSRQLVRQGIAPDTMGLFEGDSMRDVPSDTCPIPTRILLFLDNIWAESDHDETRFREEVRITYLHEVGHYLGLNEDDLAERDMD